MERFLPSTFLGLILGWVCWRTGSVLPGMLLHACHNGLLLLLACYRDALAKLSWDMSEQSHLPASWLVASLIGAAVAGVMLSRLRPAPEVPAGRAATSPAVGAEHQVPNDYSESCSCTVGGTRFRVFVGMFGFEKPNGPRQQDAEHQRGGELQQIVAVELDFRQQIGQRNAEKGPGRKSESTTHHQAGPVAERLDAEVERQGTERAHQREHQVDDEPYAQQPAAPRA